MKLDKAHNLKKECLDKSRLGDPPTHLVYNASSALNSSPYFAKEIAVHIMQQLKLPGSIVVGGIIIIAAVMLTKSEPEANPQQLAAAPKPKISVQKATTQAATLSVKSQGSVTAKREIDIIAQVSGQVIETMPGFVDGHFISEGETLIKIDERDYQAALTNALSLVAQKKRLLAEEKGRNRQAKNEWHDLGDAEANDLFLRKPQLAEAQAELDAALASAEIAKLNIARTTIRLPFDSRIKQTNVNLGQFVSVGTTIASVYDTATAEVRLALSDQQMALLDLSVASNSPSSKIPVTLTGIVAGQSHQWQAIITRTEASVDVRTRMYYAVAEVEQPFSDKYSAPLLPGLFVEAEIAGKNLSDVIVVPKEALVNRTNLYTLDADNKVQLSPVTVLSKKDGKVWLQSSALKQGTAILLEKHAVVSPGTEIEPIYSSDNNNSQTTVFIDDNDEITPAELANAKTTTTAKEGN